MTRFLTVERQEADAERFSLDAPATAGGSRADGVHLPGAPAAALRLVPVAAGVVVEAAAPGVRVGGRPVPPGSRRLLRPGERSELHCAALALEGGRPGTRVAAAALLRDAACGAALIPGARLVVLTGPHAGACHALGPDLTLGRSRTADVRVRDAHVSRVHARIRAGAGDATVEDLGSKNGVFVNGMRIDRRPWPLATGDEIVVGETSLALEDPWAPCEPLAPVPTPPTTVRPRLSPHAASALLLALCAAALALAAH